MKCKSAIAKSARRASHFENLVKAGAGEEQDRVVAGRDVDCPLAGAVAQTLVENSNLATFKRFGLIVEIVDKSDDPSSDRRVPYVGVRAKIVAVVVRAHLAINVRHVEPGHTQVSGRAGQFGANFITKKIGVLV